MKNPPGRRAEVLKEDESNVKDFVENHIYLSSLDDIGSPGWCRWQHHRELHDNLSATHQGLGATGPTAMAYSGVGATSAARNVGNNKAVDVDCIAAAAEENEIHRATAGTSMARTATDCGELLQANAIDDMRISRSGDVDGADAGKVLPLSLDFLLAAGAGESWSCLLESVSGPYQLPHASDAAVVTKIHGTLL